MTDSIEVIYKGFLENESPTGYNFQFDTRLTQNGEQGFMLLASSSEDELVINQLTEGQAALLKAIMPNSVKSKALTFNGKISDEIQKTFNKAAEPQEEPPDYTVSINSVQKSVNRIEDAIINLQQQLIEISEKIDALITAEESKPKAKLEST
jgi:septal ring factor EnvC (AmiA/AmiB activator)